MKEIIEMSKMAVAVLGENPNHSTKQFTAFQQNHFGQYVSIYSYIN